MHTIILYTNHYIILFKTALVNTKYCDTPHAIKLDKIIRHTITRHTMYLFKVLASKPRREISMKDIRHYYSETKCYMLLQQIGYNTIIIITSKVNDIMVSLVIVILKRPL